MVKRVLQEIQSRILCNNIILGYPELKCEKDKVNLHCFYPEYTSQAEDNLGDYLSKVVVEWMLEQKSLTLSTKISEGGEETSVCNRVNYVDGISECNSMGNRFSIFSFLFNGNI